MATIDPETIAFAESLARRLAAIAGEQLPPLSLASPQAAAEAYGALTDRIDRLARLIAALDDIESALRARAADGVQFREPDRTDE